MSWFAILLALASLGGAPSAAVRKQCAKAAVTKHQKQQCKTVDEEEADEDEAGGEGQAARGPAADDTAGAARPDAPSGGERRLADADAHAGAGRHADPDAHADRDAGPREVPVTHGRGSERVDRPPDLPHAGDRPGRVQRRQPRRGRPQPVRAVGGTEYGKVDVAPGDTDSLVLQLAPGTYTLYCSLTGHEEQGMRADISVR